MTPQLYHWVDATPDNLPEGEICIRWKTPGSKDYQYTGVQKSQMPDISNTTIITQYLAPLTKEEMEGVIKNAETKFLSDQVSLSKEESEILHKSLLQSLKKTSDLPGRK